MTKLATDKRPAVVRVRSIDKADEIVGFAQQRGWKVIVGVEADQVEDLSDLHKLMRTEAQPEAKPRLPPKISGNDHCPCRSGKKFKKCCGATVPDRRYEENLSDHRRFLFSVIPGQAGGPACFDSAR